MAIAKAIIDEYQLRNVGKMQDALRDIFGPMFEAMLWGKWILILVTAPMTMGQKLRQTVGMDISIKQSNPLMGIFLLKSPMTLIGNALWLKNCQVKEPDISKQSQ